LGQLADAAVSIELGRARGIAEALALDAADPRRISDAERHTRYMAIRQQFVNAQAAFNAAQSDALSEDKEGQQRHLRLTSTYHKVMEPTSPSKHGREGACIEYSANVCDLTTLDLIPFSDESRSGRGVGDHIVQHAYIVAVNEHLLEVNALDNGSQPLSGCEIIVGFIECVNWTLEDHVVLHQIPSSGEISLAERRPVTLNDLTCTSVGHV
jgi:hypothetical protein